jgi:electron transfer flavoprotein beta subunit
MGPPSAVSALREVVAMGCDSAVLLSHRAFAGADTRATSRALAAAVGKLAPFDLVVCGERATDGDTGQVGPSIAAFLDLPVATYIGAIDEADAKHLRVRRLVENGHELLDVELPAVLTVVKEIGEARLPTLRGKRRARAVDIPVWGPDDIGVSPEELGLAGSPTRVVKIFRPTVARQCRKMPVRDEASLEAAVNELAAFLEKKDLI